MLINVVYYKDTGCRILVTWIFWECQISFHGFMYSCTKMGLNQQYVAPQAANISCNKASLCCLSRRTEKALFGLLMIKLHGICCLWYFGHRNIFAFLFIVWKLVSSNVAPGSGLNVFIHKFGSVMFELSKPKMDQNGCLGFLWSNNEQGMRCLHSHCETILGQASRSLVSLRHFPTVFCVYVVVLHLVWK